jgi:2-polyprenyl-6-methoxyphenol hydroxylase-like FAD-dependent oxidoreductase
VPTDDAIGGYPDRQVLVVGATGVGAALALLLRRAGYDPLVVAGEGAPVRSRVTALPPSALATLDAVDVGSTVRSRGVAVSGVTVRGVDSTAPTHAASVGDQSATEASPVLVRTCGLRRALEARLGGRQRRRDTPVVALSPREDGVAVEFADGVREWFDVVVDAGGLDPSFRPAGRSRAESATLVQYETETDDGLGGNRIRERYYDAALVQRLPCPDESRERVRVTTRVPDRGQTSDDLAPETALPDDIEVPAGLDGAEPTTVRQVRVPDRSPPPGSWGGGRVAACGPVACPVAPATGFRTALAVEDALAFVRALARSDRSASAAVDAYAAGRARRLATLVRTAAAARSDHDYPVPAAAASPLTAVALLRTVALGPALCERLAALEREGVR